MQKGCFYGVSIGPGDPELMTLKAVKVLKRTKIIAVPMTKGERTLALDIAKKAVDFSDKTVLPLYFSMTSNQEELDKIHGEIAKEIIRYLDDGLDVAMPNLGDVSIYSTYSYIAKIINTSGYTTNMIAGVPSFCAVAAALNTSLTTMRKEVHILPSSHGDFEKKLTYDGTKILMKTGSKFGEIKEILEKHDLLDRAMMVENCGLESQKIYTSLKDIGDDKVSYFTTIILKGE